MTTPSAGRPGRETAPSAAAATFDNTALVRQILRLRHEKAQLLGKANFADYILERRMAKNGSTALDFTEKLHAKVKAAFDREIIACRSIARTSHSRRAPAGAMGGRLLEREAPS